MNIQFYAKNLELTEHIKKYVNEKIGGLDKYDSGIVECKVDISKDEHHKKGNVYRFEVNLSSNNIKGMVRIVVNGESINSAIDSAKDKLRRQITENKK